MVDAVSDPGAGIRYKLTAFYASSSRAGHDTCDMHHYPAEHSGVAWKPHRPMPHNIFPLVRQNEQPGADRRRLTPLSGELGPHVRALDFDLSASQEYGGMAQYARWSAERRGADPGAARAEDFYPDAWAQNVFHNYMATMTSRVNTVTGVAYRLD